jgi:hypothetical protein
MFSDISRSVQECAQSSHDLNNLRKGVNLSRLGTSLVRHLALPVHNISSSNGLMDMIGSGKVFTDVLAMRFNT